MARSCAVCGKTSMGIFNPQSSGMNRVRVHRRAEPNLHRFKLVKSGKTVNALICTRCRRTLTRTA
jgi:ribosomal protein L28